MASAIVNSAVSHDSFDIPLIDFSGFELSADTTVREATAQAILSGFQRAGFIYLKNHGISASTVRDIFHESALFFSRPATQKLALGWTTPEANRGYSQPGREKTTDAQDPAEIAAIREREGADLKETFEIGREACPERYGDDADLPPNQWPDRFDAEGSVFREKMLHFHARVKELHVQIMRAIAIGLKLDETWFDSYCTRGDNTLRLLHYPEVKAEVFRDNELAVRAGAHTDYGSITCLFQDMAGGLQVLSPNSTFVNATPIEGTVVVNAGDLLARWSNDTIKSTKHRVVEPPTSAAIYPARYSIAYFCNPDYNRFIDAIPGTYDELRPKKYQIVNSGEYLAQRLAATY